VSKSYRKVYSESYPAEDGNSFKRSKRYRSQCRLYINREKTNPEYGDVVFPFYKSFPKAARFTYYNTKNEIRQDYYLEIQETLNHYTHYTRLHWDHRTDEIYLGLINRIKGLTSNTNISEWYFQWPLEYYFEWLNDKKAKRAVKTWRGDIFDLLKYLTDTGYVEKGVQLEFKLRLAK
jgi:hypothetical protein